MGLKIAYAGLLVAAIAVSALWGTPQQTAFVVLIWIGGGLAFRSFERKKTREP